jgi:hypothetical protein
MRVVQLTPPGWACSIASGTGIGPGGGVENPVTSCDLDIIVYETAEVALGTMES